MAARLQIVVRDMARPAAIEATIRRKLGRLERIGPRITSFHVTLSMSHHHEHGPRFCARLDVRIPQVAFTAVRDNEDDVHAAIAEAVQAVRRQFSEHVRRGRDADKAHRSVRRAAAATESAE